jgi:hypothetical protein
VSYERNLARLARTGIPTVKTAQDLRQMTIYNNMYPELVVTLGTMAVNDGGMGEWYWDATSTDADNTGTILQLQGVATGRYKRLYSDGVQAEWFGATGTTNDTAVIQAAMNADKTVRLPEGDINAEGLTAQPGQRLYGHRGRTNLKAITPNSTILTVKDAPMVEIHNINFYGLSSIAERGEDVNNVGVYFDGRGDANIDAYLGGVWFLYCHTGILFHGRNVTIAEYSGFSNSKYGVRIDTAASADWRDLMIDNSVRFHSIGKTPQDHAAGVYIDPTSNFQEVSIVGVIADDCTTLFRGFASQTKINAIMPKARGHGIWIDPTGHGMQIQRRLMDISLNYSQYFTGSSSTATAPFAASAIYQPTFTTWCFLNIHDCIINGCGGHGIHTTAQFVKVHNNLVHDAGQFANRTYSAYFIEGDGSIVTDNAAFQDRAGVKANKAVHGFAFKGSLTFQKNNFGAESNYTDPGSSVVWFDPANAYIGMDPVVIENDPRVSVDSAAPTTGKWNVGSIVYNKFPNAAINTKFLFGWVCTQSGTPGQWTEMWGYPS